MAKCHANRKARLRRLKRKKDRLIRDMTVPVPAGVWKHYRVNENYYDAFATVSVSGRGIMKIRWRVRPNAKYRDLIRLLIKECGDVKVDLSSIRQDIAARVEDFGRYAAASVEER